MSLMGGRYAHGGMVAFARSGEVEDEDDGEDGGGSSEDSSAGPVSMTPSADLVEYKRMMADKLKEKVTKTLSPLEQRKKMMEGDPETYGVLAKKPGEEYLSGIQAMLQKREAEAEKQRGENSRLKELGTYAAMSKAAEATRGMRGGKGSQIAAMLGSFGQQMGGLEKESVGREQALREDLLKRQELQNAAKFEVEKLQVAKAEGDVKGEQQHAANIAKLENALRVSQNSILKGAITGAYGAAGKAYAADVAAKARVNAASINANKPEKLTDLSNLTKAHMDALVNGGADPADPQVKLLASQRAARDLSRSAGSYRAEVDAIDKANTAFQNETLRQGRELRKLSKEDSVAYNLRLESMRGDIEKRYKVRPDADAVIGGSTTSAAAKPAAAKPAAGITPEQFDAQWAKLDPGQTLVGPDGKTYTKK